MNTYNIPIDDDTIRKLEMLSNRWGISVPTLAESALFLGVDYWLADLKHTTSQQSEQARSSHSASDGTGLDEETNPPPAPVAHRRKRRK